MKSNLDKTSKYLSYILRHHPESIKIELDSEGWADIDEIIKNANKFDQKKLYYKIIEETVKTNDKQRFSISPDGRKIRANQGHSIDVNLNLEEKIPPKYLYHGTSRRFLKSIEKAGIKKMNRQHVHLSKEKNTAYSVGQRHGKVIILVIDSLKMYNDGIKFYLSENEVWLTDYVAKEYITFENSFKNEKSGE